MENTAKPAITIPKQFEGRVIEKRQLYANVFFLTLETNTPVPFQAGQYASFIMNDIRRPFSFACPTGKTTIDFIIGTREAGTTHDFIQQLQVDSTVPFLAPYGRFMFQKEDARPLLFIAAGTGLAPIRAQLHQALSLGASQPITLYFAHHDEERLFLHKEFVALEKQYSNFHYIPVLNTPSENWAGKKGLVTTVIPEDIQNLSEHTAYVCGSPGMVDATVTMLKNNHVPAEHIHFEQFT